MRQFSLPRAIHSSRGAQLWELSSQYFLQPEEWVFWCWGGGGRICATPATIAHLLQHLGPFALYDSWSHLGTAPPRFLLVSLPRESYSRNVNSTNYSPLRSAPSGRENTADTHCLLSPLLTLGSFTLSTSAGLRDFPGGASQSLIPDVLVYEPFLGDVNAVLVHLLSPFGMGVPRGTLVDHLGAKPFFHLLPCVGQARCLLDDQGQWPLSGWWLISLPAGLLAQGTCSDWSVASAEDRMGMSSYSWCKHFSYVN